MEYEKTIHLEEPGTLGKFISYSERQSLTSLKVTGVINRKDIDDVLDEMCSSEGHYEGDPEDDIWVEEIESSPNLRILDLSESRFVGGNEFPYMGWYPLLEYFAYPQGIESTCDEHDSGLECASLLNTVVLPEGLKEIGSFHGCENLTDINLPESLEVIGDFTFSYCRKLTNIRIPRNVKYIGAGAFAQSGIGAFEVDPQNPYFTTVDGVIFSKDLKTLVAFPPIQLPHYDIPEGTEIIGTGAFEDCNLDTIHIPETVKKLDTWAFQSSGLREIYIPDSVIEIGEMCFRGSSELERIRLPQHICQLTRQAISGCKKLKEIDIPASVKQMDITNIVWNESLERVCLHEGLEEITGDRDGLCLCEGGLLKEISLPKTLRHFPGGMFHYCPDLKTFNLDPENPYLADVGGAFYSHDKSKLVAVPDCHRKAFDIMDGVEEIGEFVFVGFARLEHVQLPASLKRIGHRAFNWCHSLKEITLPEGLVQMDFRTFDDCESLQHVICLAQQPPQLNGRNPHWKFLHDSKGVVVEVPAESLSLYRDTDGWKDVNLQAIDI